MTDGHMTDGHENDGHEKEDLTRRDIVLAGLGALAAGALAACGRGRDNTSAAASQSGPSSTAAAPATATPGAPTTGAPTTGTPTIGGPRAATATTLAPTPACVDDDDVTPSQTEGPYFKANSPARADIRGGAAGTSLRLTGFVVTTSCRPVAQALVDFWQADAGGNYDNSTFGFRGHQYTDAQGRYVLETVIPGLYPGRTRHIHVKVQALGGRILTTQLYFPGEARNASDGIYRKECEIAVTNAADGTNGAFTFVLNG